MRQRSEGCSIYSSSRCFETPGLFLSVNCTINLVDLWLPSLSIRPLSSFFEVLSSLRVCVLLNVFLEGRNDCLETSYSPEALDRIQACSTWANYPTTEPGSPQVPRTVLREWWSSPGWLAGTETGLLSRLLWQEDRKPSSGFILSSSWSGFLPHTAEQVDTHGDLRRPLGSSSSFHSSSAPPTLFPTNSLSPQRSRWSLSRNVFTLCCVMTCKLSQNIHLRYLKGSTHLFSFSPESLPSGALVLRCYQLFLHTFYGFQFYGFLWFSIHRREIYLFHLNHIFLIYSFIVLFLILI